MFREADKTEKPVVMIDDVMMTPAEVAEWARCDVSTLANHRTAGEGLPYIKFGGRILYRMADVLSAAERGSHGFSFRKLETVLEAHGLPAKKREEIAADLKAAAKRHH